MDPIERQKTAFHALAEDLKSRGLLGGEESPLAEVWWAEHQLTRPEPGKPSRRTPEVYLVPARGADTAQVEAAHQQVRGWDWGPGRPPKITLETPR